MMQIIPSEARYHGEFGWLDTRWHFSFGDYHDPANVHWGALRVFNDDIVHGGGKFDMHPHRDMEIITYMISGELRHTDSIGNSDVLRPGEVQVMSAGKGILHSEGNNSPTDPLRLLQIWILPRTRGNTPRWEQKPFRKEQQLNTLLPVVSSGDIPGTLSIDQDAAIYVSTLEAGKSVTHTAAPGRHAYVFVISGQLSVNGRPLNNGDQARLADETQIQLTAGADSEIILIDVP
jgi:redox-sensitive bicupin YhaK (pirin superfamily)